MGLEDVYQNNINKSPIIQTGISSGMPVSRERDPKLVKLENDVTQQMAELLYNELPKEEIKHVDKGPEVRPISFEDALKELRDMG
tara:strand:+ start:430 stop:684 length:255 start_codon:yes stop_codon:yes gene_type:complete